METLVLGSGIVGSAAAWDLDRRGHAVTVADADAQAVEQLGSRLGADAVTVDVTNTTELTSLLAAADIVVSAVPYKYGTSIAAAAIDTRTRTISTSAATRRSLQSSASSMVPHVPEGS